MKNIFRAVVSFILFTWVALLHADGVTNDSVGGFFKQQLGNLKAAGVCQFTQPAVREGNVKLNLAMYNMGNHNRRLAPPQVSFALYQQDLCKQLIINIPQQYAYWDASKHNWVGPLVCGGQESGADTELRHFYQNGKPVKDVYLLNEISCGSLGCSYQLTIGHINPKSLDICNSL